MTMAGRPGTAASSDVAAEPPPPSLVAGRYRPVSLLGAGGVAVVYRAVDERCGREVALKMLLPQLAADASVRRTFVREAGALRLLDHPAIVRCLDAAAAGDEAPPFIVLDFVAGGSLRRHLDAGVRLDDQQLRALGGQIAAALDHAHRRGVLHLDLKPANILLDEGGAPKLADFGAARVQAAAGLTGSSQLWGSPAYMAPELFRGERGDPRSDLFSLGVILFECAAGSLPWGDASPLSRVAARSDPPGEAVTLPASLDGSVAALIRQLLSYEPAYRPASAAEVMARLDGLGAAVAVAIACPGCGRGRPQDLPCCPGCGDQPVTVRHTPGGRWMLVLQPQPFDAERSERLLRVLDAVTGRRVALNIEPSTWMWWKRGFSPAEERSSSLQLPALLFGELDEQNARDLQRLFREAGIEAEARTRAPLSRPHQWMPGACAVMVQSSLFHYTSHIGWTGTLAFCGLGVVAVAVAELAQRRKWYKRGGRFRLRPEGATAPRSRGFLEHALREARALRTEPVRDLLTDVTLELFRLSVRAEHRAGAGLPPAGDSPAAERLMAAAPALLQALLGWARRLDELGAALDGAPAGHTARMLAALSRQPSSAALEEPEPELRRRRERLLDDEERRRRAEDERARLIADLCGVLGDLRAAAATAAADPAPDAADEQRRLAAALSEVEALLAGRPEAGGHAAMR
jgi:hypothetical protein